MDLENFVKNDGNEILEALRLSHMCHQATKLASIAAASNEAYTIYMENLKELSKKLLEVSEEQQTIVSQKKDDPCTEIHSSSLLLDSNISQKKGKKKDSKNSGRLKSSIELAIDDDDETQAMNIDNESGDENLSIGDGTGEEEPLRRSDRNEELLRQGALGGDFDGDDIVD
ncbi:hypothetical protein Q3G72_002583 [Acer saccharum]|nr:hypothetical protein Q3G72_002583 [Acer saccharum]